MTTDDNILPGVRLFVHQDAIKDNTVRFVDDLGIDIKLPKSFKFDKDGWLVVNQSMVQFLTSSRTGVEIVTYVGGGYYQVKNDPELQRFHFSTHKDGDRLRAEKYARLRAAELAAGDEVEDEKVNKEEEPKKESKK